MRRTGAKPRNYQAAVTHGAHSQVIRAYHLLPFGLNNIRSTPLHTTSRANDVMMLLTLTFESVSGPACLYLRLKWGAHWRRSVQRSSAHSHVPEIWKG